MRGYACQYAIVRFLPYAETGEFANVGVVLACPETGYLGARLMPTRKTGRITGFFDQLDKRVYREAMIYLQCELDRVVELVRAHGAGDQAFVQKRFAGLVRSREAVLRFGETRVVLAEDPAETMSQLFGAMVERDFADKAYHDQLLVRGVRETLRKADLRKYFKDTTIGNDDLFMHVPFVHELDGLPQLAIKPIDLAKDEARSVYDVGGRCVDRVWRLQQHDLMPEAMLFAVNLPRAGHDRAMNAANEILGNLSEIGVRHVPVADKAAITAFARGAVGQ